MTIAPPRQKQAPHPPCISFREAVQVYEVGVQKLRVLLRDHPESPKPVIQGRTSGSSRGQHSGMYTYYSAPDFHKWATKVGLEKRK